MDTTNRRLSTAFIVASQVADAALDSLAG